MDRSPDQDVAMTIVSAEEQMRGWLAEIKRRRAIFDQIYPYERLAMLIKFWIDWTIVPLDRLAANEFEVLRRRGPRIGTQDLKIAAIALANEALLVSRNLHHFKQVPGLRVESWLD
jgi:tRNA(fMet)-specific endonuclease VapC